MDLHVVNGMAVVESCREEGRVTFDVALLERQPERLYGLELRDAYLHLPVSDALLAIIRMRVGRAGKPGDRHGGDIWQRVP